MGMHGDDFFMICRVCILFYKHSNHEIVSHRKNKSQELRKVNAGVQATTINSLTANGK